MKKTLCMLMTLLLACCTSALAEECKYAGQGSPCEPGWWVDRDNQMHARACFYHVEDKEDMNSHVLITDWAPCTPDEGGKCTGCSWDYDTSDNEPSYDESEMYMLEFYMMLCQENGVAPVAASVSGSRLTISMTDDFFAVMDEMGMPVSETMMVETEYSLSMPGGTSYPATGEAVVPEMTVEASEYGPGAWLEKYGLLTIGSITCENNTEPGAALASVEITVENGQTYTLTKEFTIEGEAGACGHEETYWVLAGTAHAKHCAVCETMVSDFESCQRACTNPTLCTICGLEGEYEEYTINHNEKYVDHGEYHSSCCVDCGKEFTPTYHYAICTEDTSRCHECGAEGDIPVNHNLSHVESWTDNGADHTGLCGDCGNEFTGRHLYPDYEFDPAAPGQHRAACFCGRVDVTACYVTCMEQSVCYACGGPVENVTWENRYCIGNIEWLEHDEENHTYSCDACGETYTEPHYLDEQGSCEGECGYRQESAADFPGDADNDANVDVADALAVLQRVTDGSVSINEINADVNNDGVVDTADVLLILQYTAGWDVILE